MIIATANIQNLGVHLSDGNDLSRKDVRKSAGVVASINVSAAGFQEIAEVQDREDLKRGLGSNYHVLIGSHQYTELAVAIDTRELNYVPGSLHEHMLSKGEAGLEPNRFWLQTRNRIIKRPSTPEFALGTIHTVSKAFSPGSVADRSHRVDLWNQQWDESVRHMKENQKDGIPTFGTGDLNRAHDLPRIPGMRVLAHVGLDWVWVIEVPGWTFLFHEQIVAKSPSDHPVVAVRGELVKA